MIDFTFALYLGLHHPSASLPGWAELTTGRPAALASPPGSARVAAGLAALVGCEAGTLAPSTLHLFLDLPALLPSRGAAVWLEEGSYPVARWGAERARALGVPVRAFPHRDPEALTRALWSSLPPGAAAVVIVDGVSPGCPHPVPLAGYLDALAPVAGHLVVDDTQALGVLGRAPSPHVPLGHGGGGLVPWSGVTSRRVVVVASLAKAFGVPVALLAGSTAVVRRFRRASETAVHSSPPSQAHVAAARHALAVNERCGDRLRRRLASAVERFASGVGALGLGAGGLPVPVQTLPPVPGVDAASLHRRLLDLGVRAVLHRTACWPRPSISFLLTARHRDAEVDAAIDALSRALARPQPGAVGA